MVLYDASYISDLYGEAYKTRLCVGAYKMPVSEMLARDPRQLGMALRRARRALNLSQSAVASKAGVTQATVSLLEGGAE
jgi:DNA-binding transcriptional regulator YiaG